MEPAHRPLKLPTLFDTHGIPTGYRQSERHSWQTHWFSSNAGSNVCRSAVAAWLLGRYCSYGRQKPNMVRRTKMLASSGDGNEGSASMSSMYKALGGRVFWDFRHSVGDPFDWIADFPELYPVLTTCVPGIKDATVLNLGCGTSSFCEALYDAGCHRIVNVDISPVAVEKMRARNAELRPAMHWHVADARDMAEFRSQSFDLVFDKSTLDAVAAMKSHVDTIKLLAEVSRVLKDGGVYFLVSLNQTLIQDPEKMLCMPFLAFEVETIKLGTRLDCACICCRKPADADEQRRTHLPSALRMAADLDAAAAVDSCNDQREGEVQPAPRPHMTTTLDLSTLNAIAEVSAAVSAWCNTNENASKTTVYSAFAAFLTTLPRLLSPEQSLAWRNAREHGSAQTSPETMPSTAQELLQYCVDARNLLWNFNRDTGNFEAACFDRSQLANGES